MITPGKHPIRKAPINNRGILIITPVPTLDRIQLSIENIGGNYVRTRDLFKKEADSTFCMSLSGDREGETCTFVWQGKKINMRFERGYYYRITLSQPDEAVQQFVKGIIEKTVKGRRSLTQVEFALDYYSSTPEQLKRIERYLSHHIVMKGLRARGTGRYVRKGTNTTYYQGLNGDVRKGDKGITIYAKDGRDFCRVELKAHRPFLDRQGLTFDSLPLSPTDIDILDHIAFREKIDIPIVAERAARARMTKSSIKCPKRRRASFLTLKSAIRNILTRALEANPRYGIYDLTAAEQIAMLKAKVSPHSRFKICLVRHFPAFPMEGCGIIRLKA